MNKTLVSILIASAVWAAGSLPAAAAPAVDRQITPVDRIVAVVNDDVITELELRSAVRSAAMSLRARNIQLPPMEQMRKQMADQLIMQKIQLQRAKELGIRVDDSTVNAAVSRIAEDNHMTIQQLEQALAHEGQRFADFRTNIRNEILIQRLRQAEVSKRIQIQPGEISAFIKEQEAIAAASGNVQYHIAHILVDVPNGATDRLIAERQLVAEKIAQQIANGADFAQLAAGYSRADDAMRGGDLGWRGVTRLPKVFWNAVQGKADGDIIVVRGPTGFHILKLMGKRVKDKAASSVTQTHVRHILIRTSPTVTDEVARERLLGFKHRIEKKEADFATLARLHSQDGTATRGGDLGWVYPGDFVPAFETVMNQLKPNTLSNPFKTQFGWHILEVLGRRQSTDNPEQAKVEAANALRERKAQEVTETWLSELHDQAYLDMRLDPPKHD